MNGPEFRDLVSEFRSEGSLPTMRSAFYCILVIAAGSIKAFCANHWSNMQIGSFVFNMVPDTHMCVVQPRFMVHIARIGQFFRC